MKEIWLAGGCFWGMEEYFSIIDGVMKVDVGYANGRTKKTKYLLLPLTDHAETVHITYDESKINLNKILDYYFMAIEPTAINRQGNDYGRQYRTGIYYINNEDLQIINSKITEEQKKYNKMIVVEVQELKNYIRAEEYHQDYLKKHPNGYCHIDLSLLSKEQNNQEELKKQLTPLQYQVTKENATEPPFDNAYWNNFDKGIYVDIISGEPLFTSTDKFYSDCGWPSFSKPLFEESIKKQADNGHNMQRIEVRSNKADSHLGHIFEDNPSDKGGLRYCINSASLRFIPLDEMEKQGYGQYIKYVK